MNKLNSTLDWQTALLLTLPPLFWAGNAIVGRMMVGQFPPLALSFWRWVLSIVLMLPFVALAVYRERSTLRLEWRNIAWIGLFGIACYNSFQYLALQTTTPLNVTLIAASSPVFIMLTGCIFFGERIQARELLGSALSILGVMVVVTRAMPHALIQLSFAMGDLIMLLATITWSIYTWRLRKHRPQLAWAVLMPAQMVFGVIIILPFMLAEVQWSSVKLVWNSATIAGLIYVATFPSLLAYYCWDRGVTRVGPQLPTYFANLTPVFAALLGIIFLGDAIHIYHGVGAALIFLGIHVALKRGN